MGYLCPEIKCILSYLNNRYLPVENKYISINTTI